MKTKNLIIFKVGKVKVRYHNKLLWFMIYYGTKLRRIEYEKEKAIEFVNEFIKRYCPYCKTEYNGVDYCINCKREKIRESVSF